MPLEIVESVPTLGDTTTHVAGLRSAERDQVIALIESDHRLITLTGLGGIGKSALAVDVVDALLAGSPGISCVRFAVGPSDGASIRTRLTDELGVAVDHLGGTDEHIAGPQLAVIDGGEHLGEHVAELGAALDAAPWLRLLVTSRLPLGLASEVTVPVRGLATVAGGDAVTFFLSLAKEISVRISAADRSRVHDLVTRLGGYPLAIRLCVAQLATMSIGALHRAMVAPDETASPARTDAILRQVIGWSLDRQTSNVVQLLQQLSVFGGWSTLDSVEGIAAIVEARMGRPDRSVASRTLWLAELVEAGLVAAEPAPLLGDDVYLYRVHDSIREVARGYVVPGGAPHDLLTAAHHEWYSGRVAELASHASTRHERHAFEQATVELEAYVEALDLMVGVDPTAELHIVNRLGEFWVSRGRMRTGARLLRRGLEQLGEDSEGYGHGSVTTVLAQSWLAHMKMRERAPLDARTYLTWLSRHLDPVIDGSTASTSEHFALAVHFMVQSMVSRSYPAALRVGARCHALAVGAGDDYYAGLLSFWLARVSEQADDHDEALLHIRRAIAHVRRTQNESFLAKCVAQEVLQRQGAMTPAELVEALEPIPEVHLRNRSFKDAAQITIPLVFAHSRTGNLKRALELLRRNLALSRRIHYYEGQLYAVVIIAFAELSAESTPENIARCARLYGGFQSHLRRFEAVTPRHYWENLQGRIADLRQILDPAALEEITAQSPTAWPQVMAEADAFAADLHTGLSSAAPAPESDPDAPLDAVVASLSERERILLDLILKGLMDKQIADQLHLRPSTVRSYNSRVFRKFSVSSRTELLALFRGRELQPQISGSAACGGAPASPRPHRRQQTRSRSDSAR